MSENLTVAKYESLSGIAVELTADTVRQYLCRGNGKITDQEVAFFIRTCQAKQLDPLENDGANAGVFSLDFSDPRSYSSTGIGGHPAYYE